MTRLAALAIVFFVLAYLMHWITVGRFAPSAQLPAMIKMKKKKKLKPGEVWIQIFETASRDEARAIQMRLEEEDISITVFEQAKKSLSGETPPGFGMVVPKEQSAYAQQLIFRYLERKDSGEGKKVE